MPEGKQKQILLPGKVLVKHRYRDFNNILFSNDIFSC